MLKSKYNCGEYLEIIREEIIKEIVNHLENVYRVAVNDLKPWTEVVKKDLERLLNSKHPELVIKVTLKGHDVGKLYELYVKEVLYDRLKDKGGINGLDKLYMDRNYKRSYHPIHSALILSRCSVIKDLTEKERMAVYFAILRHHEYITKDIRMFKKSSFNEELVLWNNVEKVLGCKKLPFEIPPHPLGIRPANEVLVAGIELLNLLTYVDNIEARRSRRDTKPTNLFLEMLRDYKLLSEVAKVDKSV